MCTVQSKKKSEFIKALELQKVVHFQIPKTTYNADVETVHNLIELEFFDIEHFHDRKDFFTKASTYQRWFNILRKNSNKDDKSPLDILREVAPHVTPAVTSFHALDLDLLTRDKISNLLQLQSTSSSPPGGYHVPDQTQTFLKHSVTKKNFLSKNTRPQHLKKYLR